jgi:predicted ArsR family transcriptional regulator
MTTAASDTARHRALADPRRASIVSALEGAPDGLAASDLAHRLGLHENTIRWHLGVLAGAGLVHSHAEGRSTPGRPRILYTLERAEAAAGGEHYRLLATLLADTLATQAGGEAACERAGRAWGAELVRGREERAGEEVAVVAGILADQGFEPEAGADAVTMHSCPFLDLAEANPGIVCAIHRGLIDGALHELGSALAVSQLDILPRPSTCVAHLAAVRG